MKLALTSLVPTFIFSIAAWTSSVEGNKLRGLSELGGYLIGENADSSCETKDIDVCIAIDRSGSICAPEGSSSYKCHGDPNCGCDNWDLVREFTNAFIDGIDESGKVNQFAVVRFASNAGVEIQLANSAEASDVVTNLRYTSGYTNTAGALQLCRELLKDSSAYQKAILLLTDAQPTRPKAPEGSSSTNSDYAREQALEQATIAKEDEDTLIVGVFVKTSRSTSSFLEKLASPSLFFEVPDFENLGQVTGGVVDMVQCPHPPSAPTALPIPPSRLCEKADINFCIAIDRSGSVCAPKGGPYPSCKDDPSCGAKCPEWQASLDFAKDFIASAGDLPASQKFALVGFASKALEESSFVDAKTAVDALDTFYFTGGYTNTGDAIEECRRLLANDESDAEMSLILITDGTPTRPDTEKAGSPYTEAKDHAIDMANDALSEKIHITGVFVDTSSSTSSFLKQLTSPGMFMEVSTFDELDSSLSESLVELVQCDDSSGVPSASLSSSPSDTPSAMPSVSPTASPTCVPKDIDVCVAIDRSGSICNAECPDKTCTTCANWEAEIDFANNFIDRTTEWDGDQRFALVTFGTVGKVQLSLSSTDDALDVLDTIPYKFSWTNTFDGLSFCRKELENSAAAERAIVLITDGSPTRPLNPDTSDTSYGYAKEVAAKLATEIKDEGTTVITVSVNTGKYTTAYLKDLASKGFDVDANSFEDLDGISGRIFALLSCILPT